MKKIVVTGATSMLGVALIKECIENDIEVLAVIRPNSSNKHRIPKSSLVEIIECGLEEIEKIKEYTNKKYDTFYHFAWDATSKQNRGNVFLQDLNITYTLNAIKVAKKIGCEMFVGAGSQAEYGRISHVISPDTVACPEIPYGIAKYAAGKLSATLCKELEMKFVWTRIFSVYGIYDNAQTMIMYCIDKLLKNEAPQLTKCEQKWDYLYCEDAARAFKLIGEKGRDQSIYCIGSGQARPLHEYVGIINNAINKNLETRMGAIEYSANQVMHLCADITNLTEDTGFTPSISFEEGINKTIKWFKES